MDLDLDAIEARAKAADQGTWRVGPNNVLRSEHAMPDGGRLTKWIAEFLWSMPEPLSWAQDNAAHIAGLDPQTVLALAARVRDAEADNLLLSTCASAKVAEQLRTAEAESARLRAVVEKLRAGLAPLQIIDARYEEKWGDLPDDEGVRLTTTLGVFRTAARLLAETAPDVPADQDGRAGP